jgi:hypothetical protein
MPHLTTSFTRSDPWRKLSQGAKTALQGLIQLAIPRHAEWTVEGSAIQVADWVGSESGLGRKAVQDGLLELEEARLVKRARTGASSSGYVITAPITER